MLADFESQRREALDGAASAELPAAGDLPQAIAIKTCKYTGEDYEPVSGLDWERTEQENPTERALAEDAPLLLCEEELQVAEAVERSLVRETPPSIFERAVRVANARKRAAVVAKPAEELRESASDKSGEEKRVPEKQPTEEYFKGNGACVRSDGRKPGQSGNGR